MEQKKISIFKALRDSAQNVIDNFPPFIFAFAKMMGFVVLTLVAIFVVLAIVGGASMITELKTIGELAKTTAQTGTEISKESAQQVVMAGLQFIFNHLFHWLLVGFLALCSFGLLGLAYTRFALNITDKTSSHFSIFTSANLKLLPRYLIATFLFWLILCAGLIAFIIPGIIFYIRFGFFNYFIVDQNAGIFESLRKSWRATSGYGWDMLVLYIIYWAMSGAPVLGVLLTSSIGILMIANTYRQLTLAKSMQI